MQSIRPRTYNELIMYKQCLELRRLVPEITNEIFARIYCHMLQTGAPTIAVANGKLVFYLAQKAVDSMAVAENASYISLKLSVAGLSISRPVTYYSSGSDSGSSGNNNNNNNNNNNG